jgi:NAD+--asparagine ADP-ribosyltransferase
MNKGRAEFFKETKVISGYQFAAVLDDRTSDICNGLHGKKFVAGTEPVPPMHFNCRSVLVPITIYEEFEPDEKVGGQNIETFIEDNIGKGFAKQ